MQHIEKYVSEAARYKVEQEKLARKMHNEEKNITNLNWKLNKLEDIRRALEKKKMFNFHKDNYEAKKKYLTNKLQQSTDLLEKMKKSKLYTGEEKVTAVNPDGSEVERKMHIGSTLYYGKQKAKTLAKERDAIKRDGFAIHNGTYDDLVEAKIAARKKSDKELGLTS